MDRTLFEEVRSAVRNWWVSLIVGVLFIALALFLMFRPIQGYEALVVFFSVCIFLSGVLETIFAISNRNVLYGWGWYFAAAIIDLILGIVLISLPAVTAALIPIILAIWIMFRGFSAIGSSMELRRMKVSAWGWYLAFGIVAILCSIAIIWNPMAGAIASLYVVAFSFLIMGFFRIMLGFELRNLYGNIQNIHKRIAGSHEMNEII